MTADTHQLGLELRAIETLTVGCPSCGAPATAPCIGTGDVYEGLELQFHHYERLVAADH